MFHQNSLARSNLTAMLLASAEVSAIDDIFDDANNGCDGVDIVGLESIPTEVLRAMMHAEAFRVFPKD